jgi:diketogulonate reductase-like aldo/keto reductase
MKGGVEYAFVAQELLVRTGRHLVVLTLPLVCWLAGQECPAQALLAWVVQSGTTLLTARRTVACAGANFDHSPLPQDALDEINQIQIRQRLNPVASSGVPGLLRK